MTHSTMHVEHVTVTVQELIQDYKKHPEDYKGHVGHVSTVIRLAVMGRTQSPDVWEIQQILGEERTKARIGALLV